MTLGLSLADGPADPPSSRPHRGVLGGQVRAYGFVPAAGVVRIDVDTVRVAADTVLRWAFYADGDAATQAPHASLAATVDVRTAAGARLSDDSRVRDRYGFGLGANVQFGARWSMPEQWSEDAVSLAPFAGEDVTIEVVLGAEGLDGAEEVTGFIEVIVEESPLSGVAHDVVDRVDTRRGSHSGDRYSRGNTIPAATLPHGFVFVTPATDADNTRWPYRPYLHDDEDGRRLEALQFSHQPSPWIGDRGVLQVRPYCSSHGDQGRIVPGTEVARPHMYSAELRSGLTVQTVPTQHGAAFHVRGTGPVGLSLTSPEHGAVTGAGDGFSGWISEGDPNWGNPPRTYFAGIVRGGTIAPTDGLQAEITGTDALDVHIALSFISVDVAQAALVAELSEPLETLRDRAAALWRPLLSAVTIPEVPREDRPFRGLSDAQRRADIAGALYRMHAYPNTMAERVGDGLAYADPMTPAGPHGETHTGATVREGELIVNNGYWDTYRTVWSALTLLDPTRTATLLDGLLEQYRSGGWMARWSAPGYVDSMVGTSSDQIFADAHRWGVAGAHEEMFASGVRNACEPSSNPRSGRKGIGRGRFRGWISRDVHEGMSWSLENAISDAALAGYAQRLSAGRDQYDAYARYFANRSLGYRALFDPRVNFFRGREEDGSFGSDDFDPRVWGGDYVETNAWGMSVSAVHDGAGLAELYGGPAGLRDHLDALFAEPETGDERFGGWYGTVIHEQREARGLRAGMCGISNQPAHHIPHMYVFTDQPWLAGVRTRELAGRLFAGSAIAQGFPGDEDNGEMSAWWLWAALGLYPLELGSGYLAVGIPLVDDITLTRASGTSVRVRVRREEESAWAVVRVLINGVEQEQARLDVSAFDGDVDIEIVLGDNPADSPLWQTTPDAREHRPDLTPHAQVAGVTGAETVTDDGDAAGDAGVLIEPGERVTFSFTEPVTITDATLTLLDGGGITWSALDGDAWREIVPTAVSDAAPHRTLPVRFAAPVTTTSVAVSVAEKTVLRQIELFDLS